MKIRSSLAYYGRTTPFIVGLSTLFVTAARSESNLTGYWQFVEDDAVVLISPSSPPDPKCSAKLVSLSKAAAALPPEAHRALCGLVMIGDLKPTIAEKKGELQRFEGWVIDPEEFLESEKAKRYPTSFVLISEKRARLDVHGPAGVVYTSYALRRVPAPSEPCR